MKDIEKIKSEDLAAQVQDANPGNFAIEQEVAQLVGATVPAPTEPSADDARELGAQLLVFLRRALLPIRSALRTAVAAIYAHLDSRCTDYTPAAYAPYSAARRAYDPMGTLPARSVANLLTALTAFAPRKISNGSAPNDGIPDGVSLAHLLLSAASADVVKIDDDNTDWTLTKGNYVSFLNSQFPNAEEITMRCKDVNAVQTSFTSSTIKKLNIIGAKTIIGALCINLPDGEINAPDLETLTLSGYNNGWVGPIGRVIYMPKVTTINGYSRYFQGNTNMPIERWVLGTLKRLGWSQWGWTGSESAPRLIDFEICADGGKLAMSLNLNFWTATYILTDNPTGNDLVTDEGISTNLDQFLQNFKEHIALRLTSNGSGKTLTLSQAVRDAIHAAEATYGIEAIIVTQKGWTLSPAPTA